MFGRVAPLITMSVLLAPVAHADEANQPTVAPAPTVRVVSKQQVPNITAKSLETLSVSFGPWPSAARIATPVRHSRWRTCRPALSALRLRGNRHGSTTPETPGI
jgi:hypothetical protein